MPSKGVLDRQRVGKAIIAAANTHAREVGERLNERVAVVVEHGETLADFTTLKIHLGRYLQMQLDALVAADEVHLKELDDDHDPRLRRDEAAEALNRKLVEVRNGVSTLYGTDQASALIGIEGATSRDPLTLHRQANRAMERLRAPEVELPPQRLASLHLDTAALVGEVQPLIDQLTQALADVDREQRETETSLGLKTEALEAFDRAVRGVGRIIKGCDELAEYPDFAEKIRLSRTRRGSAGGSPAGDPQDDEGPSEPGPQPDVPSGGDDGTSTSSSLLGFALPVEDEPPPTGSG